MSMQCYYCLCRLSVDTRKLQCAADQLMVRFHRYRYLFGLRLQLCLLSLQRRTACIYSIRDKIRQKLKKLFLGYGLQ